MKNYFLFQKEVKLKYKWDKFGSRDKLPMEKTDILFYAF